MKKRSMIVRIVAIVMCVLMVLGIVAGAITAFAAEPSAALPSTGSSSQKVPIILGVCGAVLVIACIVLPRLVKKPQSKSEDVSTNERK